MATVSPAVERLVPDLVALRRALHRHPELGYQEVWTAGLVAERLRGLGYTVRTGVGKTGVTGFLAGGRAGRTLLIRADMDALPIQEEADVPWRSERPGVMHACGHDSHVAMALAAAEVLAREAPSLPGNLYFVFQPAEEGESGALAMLRDGLLETVKPEAGLALHSLTNWPAGTIAICDGPAMASADRLEIQIGGRGGHAATPHLTADPIVAAAQLILALQTLVSRETPPLEAAALSITTLQAGSAFNVIPDRVELTGTLRCFSPALREALVAGVGRVAEGVAAALRCTAKVTDTFLTPAVLNDPEVTRVVREAAAAVVGADRLLTPPPLVGSEDVAIFWERVPGCFAFLGVGPADGSPGIPFHTAKFTLDESALPIGVEFLVQSARRLLQAA